MILHLSTWPEIEAYLGQSQTIVIPIGSNEQHGPTGLLGTDWLCPEIIAHRAEQLDPGVLVGPTFNVGMAQHHLAFPGTISLRPSTMMLALRDWVQSLVNSGFRTIYFLNGHGGNTATIEAAFSEIYADASFQDRPLGFTLILRHWWQLEGVDDLAHRQFPIGHGSHATPSEIAVTQAAYPNSVRPFEFDPEIASNGPVHEALDFRSRYPDGRMGSNPALATPAHGEELIAMAANGLKAEIREIIAAQASANAQTS